MSTIRIASRFRGPPDSGNGGYVAGLIANALGGSDCVVTLKLPPPLEHDLTLDADGSTAVLRDGAQIVGEAVRQQVEVDAPPPPSVDEAEQAERSYSGFAHHIFPGCFVCGPERGAGDGLRLFPGPLNDGSGQVASNWVPDRSLDDGDGWVRPEFVWAALDCPGYFAVEPRSGPAVLGRLAAGVRRRVRTGERLVVTGWPIESSGRKHRAGTAVHDQSGELVAAAMATWISLKQES